MFPKKLLLFGLMALALSGLGIGMLNQEQAATAQRELTPTPTATQPPPPPQIAYTEIESDEPLPMVIQRQPRRGERLAPDGVIELIFDRPMAQTETADAFTLQRAAESPQPVAGEVSWPGERIMQFTPAEPLQLAAVYDAILTQEATDANELPLAEPFTFRFQTPGYLQVSQVIPAEGGQEIETDATITVMFNRPVVPLTSLGEMENLPQPLSFQPPIQGAGEWLNTSIYLFTPAEELPGGTTFLAQVDGDLTDAAGESVMAADFEWQFTTHPPEVVFTTPGDGSEQIAVDAPLEVTFNQLIDSESAQEHFSLSSGFWDSTVDGNFQVDGRTLIFTPTEQLEFNTAYEATINAGVTAMAGGQGSQEAYRFHFTTVPLPEVVATFPRSGAMDASPYGGFMIEFNTTINPNTVMPHVSFNPPLPITPTEVYTYFSPWDNSFNINFGIQPSTNYEVQISPGIEDPYGNQTEEELTVNFRTAPLPPHYQLRTPGMVGTYDAALPAKLMVSFVNINQLDLTLFRLEPEDIRQQRHEWYNFNPPSESLIRKWSVPLETPADQIAFHMVDLVEEGGTLEPGLYYLVTHSPQVEPNQGGQNQHVLVVSNNNLTMKSGERDALVWATDLATGEPQAGLPVTFYNEAREQVGQATTDINGLAQITLSDQPYRPALLAVVESEDATEFAAVSDEWSQGIQPHAFGLDFTYDLPEFTTHIYTDRPLYRPAQTVYFKGVIRAEDDVSFMLPDLGEVSVVVRDANYETVFEEELPLSPMGTFNGELTMAEGAPLGNYVISVEFNDQYFEQSFQVAAYRPPEFEIEVTPSETELLRNDDLEAMVNVSYFFGGPLADTEVEWNLLAEPYYFEPAQFGSYSFTDSDSPYVCFDCWWWQPDTSGEQLLSGSGTTDATGQLTVTVEGAEIDAALAEGSYRLILEATANGPDNQTISGRESVTLHRGDYYIGLSPQEYVADAGEETALDIVAVDWQANRLPQQEIAMQVIRREWVNRFTEGVGWTSEVEQTMVETFTVTTDENGEAVARFTPPQGGSYQVVAQDAATLQPPAEDEIAPRAAIRSALFIWVTGEDAVSWRRENHDRITLISDKASYAPGETAEILVPSPFEGEQYALITVERGRIIEQEVIEMSDSSLTYELPIGAEHAPNVYVSVVLVKGRLDNTPPVAEFKVGILPLDVKPLPQQLSISLTPEVTQAQPGEAVTYNLVATDAQGQPVAAEFSLDLVDKAVLSLSPRTAEAIVQAFYQRRGLGINTATGLTLSVNRLLQELAEDLGLDEAAFLETATTNQAFGMEEVAEEEMAYSAADAPMEMAAEDGMMRAPSAPMAADQAQAAPLPPGISVREDFSDTAYWQAIINTNENGEATVTVDLPDNLTTWTMRGVGVTAETEVGEGTVELQATKPLLIRPVTPRFFVVDDRAELAANISNNTDTTLQTEVTLSAEGVTLSEQTPAVQTVEIAARSERKVTWDVTVNDVETAKLTFAAVSGEYSDAALPRLTTGPEGTLKVFRYTTPDTVGTAGYLAEGGTRSEIIALPPTSAETGAGFDDQRGGLSIQIDPSLAAGMQDGLSYLEHYEYECTEQTVSRFLPNLLTYDALQRLGLENPELAARLPGLVDDGLSKLTMRQNSDGGWGWWPEDRSSLYISSYVVFGLTKAQQAGVDVSAEVLAKGQQYLKQQLQQMRSFDTSSQANQQAFVVYVLAEDNQAAAAVLNDLFENREKLAHFGRAYLAMALNLADEAAYQSEIDTLLSDINNAAILSATGAHWEENQRYWWAMNTDTRSTAIILDALTKLDPDNALNPNVVRWLMVAREGGVWETTQETAWAIIALTDWMVETGELEADYEYQVTLNQDEQLSGEVTADSVQVSNQVSLPIAELVAEASNRLTIARTDGNGRLYYSAHLEIYQPVEQVSPAERGIIVERRYTLASCEERDRNDCPELREAALGETIRVDLTIIAPNDLYYVVLEDPLPAGAEAIDTGLATTSLLAMAPGLSRNSRADFGEAYYSDSYFWWWRWYSRSELRDEKVVLFADSLPAGTYEYSYTMRTTLPGDYQVLPTTAHEFYFPEVFGRSAGRLLSIGR